MSRVTDILKRSISQYGENCDGYPSAGSTGYMLGVFMDVGVVKWGLRHEGSKMLDEINAFDTAEKADTYMGQINMSIVSSFCGPQGIIWGYDLVREKEDDEEVPGLKKVTYQGETLPVFSVNPLRRSLKNLFGTVNDKRFYLKPGAHVPCAGKNIKLDEAGRIYSALGIGIAADREKSACLLMEDIGTMDGITDEKALNDYRHMVRECIAKSVITVGRNQNVQYSKVLVGLVDAKVGEGETGCALVAAPYFALAQNIYAKMSVDDLSTVTLDGFVKKFF